MNLGELRTAVDRRSGLAVEAASLTSFINEAVNAIGEERPWPWLDALDSFNATAGVGNYTLPSDHAQTRWVTVAGNPTHRIGTGELDAYDLTGTERVGYGYAIEGGELVIAPTPQTAAAIIHRYRRYEREMIGDTDVPLIPAAYHPAIVAYACTLILDRAGDSRAETYRGEYNRWLRRMTDAMQRSQQPTRIRVRPGSAW